MELAEGHPEEADERTDVYLLGATLYEILTGMPPRKGGSVQAALQMARTVDPVPPRRLRPDLSPALDAICQKAMAHKKEDRYAGAKELAADFQSYLAGEPPQPCSCEVGPWPF